KAKGFLLGATAGRTTLNGEGLQHQDGHSHILASTVPNCRAYDPAFAYELAVILQHGMREMYTSEIGGSPKDLYYYITLYNENHLHPALPKGAEDGIVRGLYLLHEGKKPGKLHVQLLGSGSILREVIAAAELLKEEFGVTSDVWSATSFNELARNGQDAERWNLLHPSGKPRKSHVAQCLEGRQGPAIASTDYMKSYSEQIRPFVPAPYYTLGTDGFGRSDNRPALRDFFEVDRRWIAVKALKALADQGAVPAEKIAQAMKIFGIRADKPNPVTV
ncbi:MAG: pyruvate dehydrogenase (acetyl-transferring), homodimeric type, partial [Hydrocarboniphaga effusa]|nr:pyruvate dehydrogenase (acetyl-transferring), homodimeric type [Hydrocarboniphaga effusa]